MGNVTWLHVTRLKLFVGNREDAYKVALLDADQFVILKIHYWRGDPSKRSDMFFFVEFTDGDAVLLPFSLDLSSSSQFEEYVFSEPQLFPLRFTSSDAPKRITAMKRQPITNVNVGDTFFLDLRYFDYTWYDQLSLPNAYVTTHVVACEYVGWRLHRKYRYIRVRCILFDELLTDWDHHDVYRFGSIRALSPQHTLVDAAFCLAYPHVLPDRNRDRL